jgi:hypothetical protein
MPYPIILCGDHAEFEQEWAASGRPDTERPDWPFPSFDARDWAHAFCKVANEKGFDPLDDNDLDWVQGWFANALMRGFDEHASRPRITEKVRWGFKSRTQLPLFMVWREYRRGDEVEDAVVIFTSADWIGF